MLLSRITVYPIKSLDGVAVEQARITAGGILEHDRVFAMLDEKGAYVNGKRTPLVHQIRTEFSTDFQEVLLWRAEEAGRSHFALLEHSGIDDWLSEFFNFRIRLTYEPASGFPDDRIGYGPTAVSEASLRAVGKWFGIELAEVRRRFRANLEMGGAPAFWEDRLFGLADCPEPFRIGPVAFLGHNPCQRCVVPSRDPDQGSATAGFQRKFMQLREGTLPPWTELSRFNHFYRFATNTSIPFREQGKRLRLGDAVVLGAGGDGSSLAEPGSCSVSRK